MKTATIRDVARKAGVGLGTVSRVLNDSPLVSEATRQRVLQVIDELDYVPNPTARRLSLGKTLTIAVIAPFFTRPAVIERLRGIEHTLVESEYDLNIYNVETVKRRDICMREVPRRERADGVVILSLPPRDADIPYLAHADVPIVLIDANHPSLTSLNRVVVDDVEGGQRVTQHLIDLGHRRIGYVSDLLESPFNFTSSLYRYRGYRRALEAAGIAFRPQYHLQAEHGRYEARMLAMQMLSLPERPTAIFAASDTQALGVLEAAREASLHVPRDLSVVGYDDIEIAEYLGLTTMRQMLYESGQRGVELLLEALEHELEEPTCELMPTELVIRGTTASLGHRR
ncbi:MAG: LacI family DNA-binding transcriptional regulator [Anaerolineales bacterium]|nr:LacI family DNA-binding transcriptional regulator [Anaerolineales bacterium]